MALASTCFINSITTISDEMANSANIIYFQPGRDGGSEPFRDICGRILTLPNLYKHSIPCSKWTCPHGYKSDFSCSQLLTWWIMACWRCQRNASFSAAVMAMYPKLVLQSCLAFLWGIQRIKTIHHFTHIKHCPLVEVLMDRPLITISSHYQPCWPFPNISSHWQSWRIILNPYDESLACNGANAGTTLLGGIDDSWGGRYEQRYFNRNTWKPLMVHRLFWNVFR